jgi:hypothetical protein
LHKDLALRGIALRIAEARATVRDILRSEELEKLVGPINRRDSVHSIVESLNESKIAESSRA